MCETYKTLYHIPAKMGGVIKALRVWIYTHTHTSQHKAFWTVVFCLSISEICLICIECSIVVRWRVVYTIAVSFKKIFLVWTSRDQGLWNHRHPHSLPDWIFCSHGVSFLMRHVPLTWLLSRKTAGCIVAVNAAWLVFTRSSHILHLTILQLHTCAGDGLLFQESATRQPAAEQTVCFQCMWMVMWCVF